MGNIVPIPSDHSANFNYCTCLFELHKYTTCTNQCTFIAEFGEKMLSGGIQTYVRKFKTKFEEKKSYTMASVLSKFALFK